MWLALTVFFSQVTSFSASLSAYVPAYFALIPAAGVGARMGVSIPKQYLNLAGKSILQHSVDAFLQHPQLRHVVVVVSHDDAYVAEALQPDPRLTVLFCGGESRVESVRNGLNAMPAHVRVEARDWILVHDAARPGLSQSLITRLIDAVGSEDVGGLLALPVVDTVKFQDEIKLSTIPRTGLWLAQTPQMFRHNLLVDALRTAQQATVTDEASAVEMMGLVPRLVEGHWANAKITVPDDLAMVETYLAQVADIIRPAPLPDEEI